MSLINHARLREINNELASGKRYVARDGGYFCRDCQHVTDRDEERGNCVICGSYKVRVLDPLPIEEVKPTSVNASRSKQRLVPVNEGHARFAEILEAIG